MPPRGPGNLRRGALNMLMSAALFAGMSAAVKAASQELPNSVVVFFRNAVGLLALAPWLVGPAAPRLATRQLPGHLLRGLGGLAAMYCFFFAIGHMALADAVLLNYSLPLFLPVIERVWLKEPLPRGLGRPLAAGFLGVLLILRPGPGVFRPVALVGLMSAVFGALAQVGVRRLTRTEPVIRIVFYFALIATLASSLPLAWAWRAPRPATWAVLLATGVLATAGQISLTRAYSLAPAGRVGPFIFTGVVFAGLLDWALWGTLPGALSLLGGLLVTAAAILALRLRGDGAIAQEPLAVAGERTGEAPD
jgi:drug/metabolite transporter (DMT)-like permease